MAVCTFIVAVKASSAVAAGGGLGADSDEPAAFSKRVEHVRLAAAVGARHGGLSRKIGSRKAYLLLAALLVSSCFPGAGWSMVKDV